MNDFVGDIVWVLLGFLCWMFFQYTVRQSFFREFEGISIVTVIGYVFGTVAAPISIFLALVGLFTYTLERGFPRWMTKPICSCGAASRRKSG